MMNTLEPLKLVFLDRDGTIIVEPPDGQIDSLEKLEFIPGAIRGMKLLVDHGYALVLVTNQDRLGTAQYPIDSYKQVQHKITRLLAGEGIRFAHVFVCPHAKEDNCTCRKPKTGLVDEFLRTTRIDRAHTFVLGDRETDVEFGKKIGCTTIRLAANGTTTAADYAAASFIEACEYIVRTERTVPIERITTETQIRGQVLLDGSGRYAVSTGLGFFDHMLELFTKHSMIDLQLNVEGDLRVDEHHTIEDTGLALGEAIRKALGDKRGIGRYGFVVPMDESEAAASLDLSGRPFVVFEASFERERVGEMPTELVEDFFRALADGMRATLHISVKGRNDHHKIEAIFKAVARTLQQAVARDERYATVLPSTKGVL